MDIRYLNYYIFKCGRENNTPTFEGLKEWYKENKIIN